MIESPEMVFTHYRTSTMKDETDVLIWKEVHDHRESHSAGLDFGDRTSEVIFNCGPDQEYADMLCDMLDEGAVKKVMRRIELFGRMEGYMTKIDSENGPPAVY